MHVSFAAADLPTVRVVVKPLQRCAAAATGSSKSSTRQCQTPALGRLRLYPTCAKLQAPKPAMFPVTTSHQTWPFEMVPASTLRLRLDCSSAAARLWRIMSAQGGCRVQPDVEFHRWSSQSTQPSEESSMRRALSGPWLLPYP